MRYVNVVCVLFILLIIPVTSYSDTYFGASIGQSRSEDDTSARDISYFTYTIIDNETTDTKDTAFSLFFGTNLGEFDNLSLEFGYTDFGENTLTASGHDFGPAGDGQRKAVVRAEASAVTISIIGKKTLFQNTFLRGRVGVSAWDISGTMTTTYTDNLGNQSAPNTSSASTDGTDIYFGIGVGYRGFILGIDRYDMDGSITNYIYVGYKG